MSSEIVIIVDVGYFSSRINSKQKIYDSFLDKGHCNFLQIGRKRNDWQFEMHKNGIFLHPSYLIFL